MFEHFWLWQPVTYMFLHAEPLHILFNMLGIWMFGVDDGTAVGDEFFVRYYAVTGIGAGIGCCSSSLLPFDALAGTYQAVTIGASGALYGLLVAFALQ